MDGIRPEGIEPTRGTEFDIPNSPIPDTEQLLRQASEIRRNGIEGESEKPDSSATALEALSNIFKAFNTVAELGNSQSIEEPAPGLLQEENTVSENNADPPSMHSGNDVAQAHTETVPVSETVSEPVSLSVLASETKAQNELIKKVENKIWFTPMFDGDEKNIERML